MCARRIQRRGPVKTFVGESGNGNEGVAGSVRQTPGAIGYVELAYVLENKLPAAQLENRKGKWLDCTAATVGAAAATKPNISATDFSIVDREGASAYPIAGYTWAMVYQQPQDKTRGKLVKDVLAWIVGEDAQRIAGSLNYVPLPTNVQDVARKAAMATSRCNPVAHVDQRDLSPEANLLKAPGDPHRLTIIATLAASSHPVCVCDLTEGAPDRAVFRLPPPSHPQGCGRRHE